MNVAAITLSNIKVRSVLLDLTAILFIAFAPALSHMFALPIYMLEPMRIMLILSIVHTSRNNSYLIALVLPAFSFIISTHPSVIKTLLISSELILNVFLFGLFLNYIKNSFAAVFASILISKVFYYTVKFGFLSFGIIGGELIATPIYLQAIVTTVLSIYLFILFRTEK